MTSTEKESDVDVMFRGRHCAVTDRFRKHVEEKLTRLDRWTQHVDRIDVEVSRERNPRLADRSERIEFTVHSRGPLVRAEAAAEDRYVALDLALDKLQARLRKIADRRRVHRGARRPKSVAEAMTTDPAPLRSAGRPDGSVPDRVDAAADSPEAATTSPDGHTAGRTDGDMDGDPGMVGDGPASVAGLEVWGDGPLVVREKTHAAAPMALDEALYQMELIGHDFYLFIDAVSGLPSVVYRRCGYDYGVIRLESSSAQSAGFPGRVAGAERAAVGG